VAVLISGSFFLINLSNPLSADLSARRFGSSGGSAVHFSTPGTTLTPGTTFLARAGEQVDLDLAGSHGALQLIGPGALVVREAQIGRLRGDHRFKLDLPSGMLKVQFGPEAPAHTLRITTPQALIRLVGTKVQIQATPVVTVVEVFEGTAHVLNYASDEKVTAITGEQVQVQAGRLQVSSIQSGSRAEQKRAGQDQAQRQEEKEPPQAQPSKKAPSGVWYEVE